MPATTARSHQLFTVCALGLVLWVATMVLTATPAHSQTQEIELGATVYVGGGTTINQSVADLEAISERQLDVVRVFLLWDSPWPGPQLDALKNSGHKIYLSVRANNRNGTKVSWADLANAQPGSARHNQILAWSNRVKAHGNDMYFAFHHEPENRDSLGNGTATDFQNAWRRVVDVFRNNGVTNVEYSWTMTEYAFEVENADRRVYWKWYPGDAWVDNLAADAYNWADCRPEIDNPWRSLERQIRDFVAFGRTKPDKGMMLAEMATFEHQTDPQLKAQWIADAQALFKRPDHAQFKMVAWYNHPQAGYPACDWFVNTSPQSLAAWKTFAADPFYGGGGVNPGNQPVAPVSCVANAAGASATVSWVRAAGDNAARFVVERRRGNGQWWWLARVDAPATSFVDNNRGGVTNFDYRVKTQTAGGVNSVVRVCSNTGNPGGNQPVAPASCVANAAGASATVSWVRAAGDNAARFVVERRRGNGQWWWLARVDAPATSFVDNNRGGVTNFDYRVKTQTAGGVNSVVRVCSNTGNPGGNQPVAPASCQVTGGGTSVNVFWGRAANDNAARFVVERRRGNGQWFWLGRVSVPDNDLTDNNRLAGFNYQYRVKTQSAAQVNSAPTVCQ